MSVGACSECGGTVSDQAGVCPHCGAVPAAARARAYRKKRKDGLFWGCMLLVFAVVYTLWQLAAHPLDLAILAVWLGWK